MVLRRFRSARVVPARAVAVAGVRVVVAVRDGVVAVLEVVGLRTLALLVTGLRAPARVVPEAVVDVRRAAEVVGAVVVLRVLVVAGVAPGVRDILLGLAEMPSRLDSSSVAPPALLSTEAVDGRVR